MRPHAAAVPGSPPRPARQLHAIVDRAVLADLSERTDAHGLALLTAHAAALVATGTWVWLARGSWWLVPAVIVHGAVLAHLFALLHETSHRTVFRTGWLHRPVGHVCGFVIGLPAGYFRLEHLAHHQHTQDPERDPELVAVPRTIAGYAAFLVGLPYWWYVGQTTAAHTAGRVLGYERRFLTDRTAPAVFREARAYIAGYAAVAAVAVAVGALDVVLLLWVIPRVMGEPWMRVARMSEHAGRPLTADIAENTRSLARVPRPLRLLAWNMPFHAEHHAAPGVPFHSLPRLHRVVGPHLRGRQGGYLAAQAEVIGRIGRPPPSPSPAAPA